MSETGKVAVNGRLLVCGHCGNRVFTSRRVQLNAPLSSYFSSDATGQNADIFVCSQCGQLQWFLFGEDAGPEWNAVDVEEDRSVCSLPVECAPGNPALTHSDEEHGESTMAKMPEDPDTTDLDEDYDTECMQCGQFMPAGQTVCGKCGWTYLA